MIVTPDTSAELRALAEALGGRPAPCQQSDPDAWYALDPAPAIKLCGGCHALDECAALARANGEQHGVWAGIDHQRRGRRTVAA